MTEQEAINILNTKVHLDCKIAEAIGEMEARCVAVEALEKQIPREPHPYTAFDGIERNGCPRCFEELGRNEILYAGQRFCSVCGQAIKRS